jgi:hypothetical protein
MSTEPVRGRPMGVPQGAGSGDPNPRPANTRLITVPHESFEIDVEIGPYGEFVRVVQVRRRQDFLSRQQRAHLGYHDVDDQYRE